MSRVHIVLIPPTTHYTIVFPFNNFSKSFDGGFYSPVLTDGRAHPDEVNRVLRDIETTQKPFASKMLKAFCCYFVTLMLLVFGFIPFMIFFVPRNPTLIPVGIIGFMALIITTIVIFIKSVKRTNENSRNACLAVVERANQEFSTRGLRWHLPTHFPRWIELWKDYVGQPQMGAQPIYMPPVNQQPYGNYGVPNQGGQMGAQPQFQNNYYPGYQNNNGYMPPNQNNAGYMPSNQV